MLDAFPGPETVVHASKALDGKAVKAAVADGGARLEESRRDETKLWPEPAPE